MKLTWLLAHQKKRLHSRWVWVSVFVFGLPLFMMKLTLLMPQAPWSVAAWASTVFTPFLFSGLYVWASPIPWMWTGEGRDFAPFFRGAFQSVVFAFGAALVLAQLDALLIWLARAHGIQGVGFAGNAAAQLLVLITSLPILGYFLAQHAKTEHDKIEAERHAREAEWILLRGQLSPHVLFNALNGLAELVRVDALAAEQVILDLADLYRALTRHGSRAMAPLGDERAMLERYLSVERMRMGNRIKIAWDWDESLDPIETPPFLLQPSVENALKHGIGPSTKGGELYIAGLREGNVIVLRVANNGAPLPPVPGEGVGVKNLIARLKLAYGDAASYRLYSQGIWTLAEIRIDTDVERGRSLEPFGADLSPASPRWEARPSLASRPTPFAPRGRTEP